ncbi:MAG: hypothetical protein ACYC4H_11145 [Desulfocucumaceae bacterium]
MIKSTEGSLFQKEEVERACTVIEEFFGSAYFKRGIEQLKDSDPSGSGMGMRRGGNQVPKIVLTWYRTREELTFADLTGSFSPGIDSVMAGIVGKSLETLRGVPRVETLASGLLDDSTFGRTVFLLWVASEIRPFLNEIYFPGFPCDFFYAGEEYMVLCRQAETRRGPQAYGGSGAGPLAAYIKDIVCENRKPALNGAGRPKSVFYFDLPGPDIDLAVIGKLLQESHSFISGGDMPETAAIVLCRWQFSRGRGGIRWFNFNWPVVNPKYLNDQVISLF